MNDLINKLRIRASIHKPDALSEILEEAANAITILESKSKSETQRANMNSDLCNKWHKYVLKLYSMVGQPAHGELDTHLGVEKLIERAVKSETELSEIRINNFIIAWMLDDGYCKTFTVDPLDVSAAKAMNYKITPLYGKPLSNNEK